MKALSIRQPWAELILLGRKRYELRSWTPPAPQRIWIHAARRVEEKFVEPAGLSREHLPTGAIVGSVEISAWSAFTPELAAQMRAERVFFGPWREGLFAWELRGAKRLPVPIPWRGALGLFTVPEAVFSV